MSFSCCWVLLGRRQVGERGKLGLDPLELASRLDKAEDRRTAEIDEHLHVALAGVVRRGSAPPGARRFLEPCRRQWPIPTRRGDKALHARQPRHQGVGEVARSQWL